MEKQNFTILYEHMRGSELHTPKPSRNTKNKICDSLVLFPTLISTTKTAPNNIDDDLLPHKPEKPTPLQTNKNSMLQKHQKFADPALACEILLRLFFLYS